MEKEEHLLKEALMHEQWLFTIEDFNGAPYVTGEPYKLWSLPPREVRTGALRLRADDQPYTPAWAPGDTVVVFHPERGRVAAVLEVSGLPSFDWSRELFWTQTRVLAEDPRNGPTLSELRIPKALQGGRHRIGPRARRLAFGRFGLSRSAAT